MADCVVCLDPLISEVEGISCAPCGHLFHYQCILQWLELGPGKSKCPICKQPASPRKIRRIFLDIEAIQAAKPRTPDHATAGSSKETRNGKAPAVLSSALDVEQLQLRLLSAAVEDCKVETITQLENLVTDLNSTIRKNESTIKKSNERISDIEATVVKLTQQLELQRTELEQLQRKYQAVKKRYAVQKGLTSVAELDTLNKSAEAKHFFNTLKALPHDGLAEVLTSMEMRMTTMQRDNDVHLRKYNEERKRRQDVEARNATVEKRYIKLDKQRKQLEQKLELADQRIQEIGMRLERASNEKPSVKRQRLGGNDEEDEEKSVKQLVDQDAEDENRDPDTDWDSPSPTPVGTSSHSYRKVNGDLGTSPPHVHQFPARPRWHGQDGKGHDATAEAEAGPTHVRAADHVETSTDCAEAADEVEGEQGGAEADEVEWVRSAYWVKVGGLGDSGVMREIGG
ncbi:hypothetical protein BC938DRAFT_482174 [Jimgerdemannia flammicorona]|uniref:RING-type domain-containing protein n=1 Tax=Jimgerdemannia flammicorona TaxID=994334 RepID=A0A433QF26_9FUNG|nr:hypothetical protein BC938DRAFT_482174 [Jimgerdemannia flammicorona]